MGGEGGAEKGQVEMGEEGAGQGVGVGGEEREGKKGGYKEWERVQWGMKMH